MKNRTAYGFALLLLVQAMSTALYVVPNNEKQEELQAPSLKSVRVQTTQVHLVEAIRTTPMSTPLLRSQLSRINHSPPRPMCIAKFSMRT